eukprot:241315_1
MANEAISFDLKNIPVKSIQIIQNEEDTSYGLVIGSHPKNIQMNDPAKFFSESLSIKDNKNITQATFIIVSNINEIKQHDTCIDENTLFYYIRFAERPYCISFYLATKQANKFNVCLFVKTISLDYVTEWRNHPTNRTSTPRHRYTASSCTKGHDTNTPTKGQTPSAPSPSTPCHVVPPVIDRYLKDAQHQSINTPYGPLSLRECLDIKVRQRNMICVFGIPLQIAKNRTLRSNKYFGRFGRILNICIDGSVSILFASNASALNA